ncbi:MAG: NADH-quinone oxidoreductase subunit NuoG [Thermodesulfobacteriota bacterium]
MVTIYVDNMSYEVREGQNLLGACLSLGFDIPHFCWHPALHSVGSCRLCAVKIFRDENDTRGRIFMSCMTPATDGVRISINDAEVRHFRASVIEWLMLNHPHDCPVCDEGGECHLQDMTVMTGHAYRRTHKKKRTYPNQNLGPFINHEMNRCIQCYRCVRFYRDYAGGRDLDAFGVHSRMYFGRFKEGTLENEFSGNLVEICPTGVFTDKTLKKHYTRKWDLQTAPSICVHCGLGCNIIAGERYSTLRRILNRYNGQVNGYFLCDRGRFGYEFVNRDRRIREPLARTGQGESALQPITPDEALNRLADLIRSSSCMIGIGSPRASLEANFALRALVGEENFSTGMAQAEQDRVSLIADVLRDSPVRSASLLALESADAALVLGEDVTNTAPMMALYLRQSVRQKPMAIADRLKIPRWLDAAVRGAVQEEKGPLFIATPAATGLDDVAAETLRAAPDDIARLGLAVAHELDNHAPRVADLSAEQHALAATIAKALREAERPVVVSGTSSMSPAIIQAAANVARALHAHGLDVRLSFVVPECNSMGAVLMSGFSIEEAVERAETGPIDAVILLENDLCTRAPRELLSKLRASCKNLVVIDHCLTESAADADLVLPAGTFAESQGTLVNNEGRAQRYYAVFPPHEPIRESRHWLREAMIAAGRMKSEQWESFDDLVTQLARTLPVFEAVSNIAPPAGFRIVGRKVARQPHRYSGRTAMLANVAVEEPPPPLDRDSALSFSMEGFQGISPPALTPRYWAPGWNSVQALNKFQEEIAGPLRGGDPGRRLIEPSDKASRNYFDQIPNAFLPHDGEWLILPAYHIFGSEELSVLSPAIAERAPIAYLALNAEDAKSLGVSEEVLAGVEFAGIWVSLPVQIIVGLPQGIALVPKGLERLKGIALPVRTRIRKAETGEQR